VVKTRIALILAVALALGAYFSRPYWRKEAGPRPGDAAVARQLAPEFSLTDLSGRTLNLASYRGRVVLLDFWATWCAPCRTEIPHFIDLQNRYRDRGLEVIGISLDDDPAAVRGFYQQLEMNYPVAIGDAALAERYGGILGLPVALVIGCDGRIYSRHAGETDVSVFEREVVPLLASPSCKTTEAR
jgi:cytochrome c biogenesis protein CcmG/thiol:disulfide interchange protein DsbE